MAIALASPQHAARDPHGLDVRHVPLGPLRIFDGDLAGATEFCAVHLREGAGARIATANLDFVARARKSPALREDLAASDLVVADGAPVVWLSRLSGAGRTRRTTGVDLVAAIASQAEAAGGVRAAFYGSNEETSAAAAANLEVRYPGFRVVSRVCPPFGERAPGAEETDVADMAEAGPNLVLVALGCPRQERFIAEHFDAIPGAIWIGVGGTFDFYAGKRVRAPKLLQSAGLEWAVRLVQEPRRLWRRYLIEDLPALMAVTPGCVTRRLRRAGADLA